MACACNYVLAKSLELRWRFSITRVNTWLFTVSSVIVWHGTQPVQNWQLSVSLRCDKFVVCVCVCVADAGELPSAASSANTLPKLQWVPPQEVPLWDISNCVLEDGQILISPEEEVSTLACITVMKAHKSHSPNITRNKSTEPHYVCVCVSQPMVWTRNRVSSCLSNLSMQNLVDIDTGW